MRISLSGVQENRMQSLFCSLIIELDDVALLCKKS